MIALILKASFILAVVLAFYKLLLEKESFFAANRVYFILGLGLAFLLPFVSLPQLVHNQGFISGIVEQKSARTNDLKTEPILINPTPNSSREEDKFSSSQELALPDAKKVNKSKTSSLIQTWSLSEWLMLVYFFGVAIFSLNLLTQIASLWIKAYNSQDRIRDLDAIIVTSDSITEPCSFFNYIFINPAMYEFSVYEQIIAHEKIHVHKRHSIDLLLAEIAGVLLWFNPLIWIYRKEIEKNIEYQTDHSLVDHGKVEKTNYQLNLLKIATYKKPLAITTNYNQSVLKQRILKMNTKKSNPHSYWKYAFLFPLFFVLLLFLNKPYATFANPGNNSPGISVEKPQIITQEPGLEETVSQDKNEKHLQSVLDTSDNISSQISPQTSIDSSPTLASCKKLLEAIRAEDITAIKELLKSTDPNCTIKNPGYEIIKTFENGMTMKRSHARTPIVAAARVGNISIAELLIAAGADIKQYSNSDEAPLVSASGEGHINFVKFLVKKGVEINKMSIGQTTALHAAATHGHLETVSYLIQEGADLNILTNGQGTPLNGAARNGHIDVLELLLNKGADIDAQSNGQGSALTAAARNGQIQAMELLIKNGADLDAQTNGQGSALNAAARNGQIEVVELLIAKGADLNAQTNGQGSALNAAARNGHDETVELLLDKGADPNIQNNGQGSALNAAARHGHYKVVEVLLSKGANIDAQTNGQGSALNGAARNGHIKTVELLLEKGADINIQNNGQGSALNAAARHGHLDIVKLLLAKGADINLRSNGQGSALAAAIRNGQQKVVNYLESKGAK